jgi:hypothetical protein
MIRIRTTEGQKYDVPTDDEEEAMLLVKAQGVQDNEIFTVEVFHEATN